MSARDADILPLFGSWAPPTQPGDGSIQRIPFPAVVTPEGATIPDTVNAIAAAAGASLDRSKAGLYSSADPETIARLDANAAAARARGYVLPPTVKPYGSPLVEWGRENFRGMRKGHEALPIVEDACDAADAAVRAEERRDEVLPLKSLSMLATGDIATPFGICKVEQEGVRAIMRRAVGADDEEAGTFDASACPTGGPDYISEVPVDLRRTNFNYWMPRAVTKKGKAREVKLRLRKTGFADGGIADVAIWGAVGPKYPGPDVRGILSIVKRFAQPGARCEIFYDAPTSRCKVNVIYATDIRPEQAAAGEIFKAGWSIEFADNGTRSFRVLSFVIRNLCVNLIITHTATVEEGRTAHRGTEESIIRAIETNIASGADRIRIFSEAWGNAEKERVIESGKSPRDTFDALVQRGLVSLQGLKKDEMVNRLYAAWQREPGYNRASIVNAVTRAAHNDRWRSPWAAAQVEEEGSKLLYVRVLNLG